MDTRRHVPAPLRVGLAATGALLLSLIGPTAHASGPTVTGAGSTWVQPALDTWRADIARQGYTINYQGVGSSAGRNFYIINQVDFAASEIPFQPDEISQLQGEHKAWQYSPDVAGATTLMYNLHTASGSRITNLRLDATTAAKIFTGALTSWHDPAIQALNPGLSIKEDTVAPVTRSDGSGTSAQLSLYFADQAPGVWNAFVSSYGCPAPCSQWPQFPGTIQANGSDSVANFVANGSLGSGAIGYVEAAFAFGRGFPVAAMKNGGGTFVQLTLSDTANDVAVALTHAKLHADLTQDLTDVYRATESNAYPMSSYSYLITQTSGFDPAKGAVLGTWMIYIACGGQQEAAPLGYSPLPPNLVKAMFDAVRRIPGAPAPPPVDAAHCANPTLGTAAAAPSASGGSGGGHAGGGGGGASGGAGATNTTGGSAAVPGATATAAGPAAAAAAGAGNATANAAATEAAVALPGGQTIATLSDAQREALVADATQAAAREPSPSTWPLFLAALLVGGVIVVPVRVGRPRVATGGAEDPG